MRQIRGIGGSLDPRDIDRNDLPEVTPELAEARHDAPAGVEHRRRARRPTEPQGSFVARFVLHLTETADEVVGDVGQLLGRAARVAEGEALDDGVGHQNEPLRGLQRRRMPRRRRRARLGRDSLARGFGPGDQEGAQAIGHPHPSVDARDRVGRTAVVFALPLEAFGRCSEPIGLGFCLGCLEAKGERIDEGVAQSSEGGEPQRLGLPHVGRQNGDRAARAPLGPRQRIVVFRLDCHGDGRVALGDEGIAKAEGIAPSERLGFAVEAGEDTALFARARPQNELDLAQTVIVAGVELQRDVVAKLHELLLARRTVESNGGRLVEEHLDRQGLGGRDDHAAEARDHPERGALGQGQRATTAPAPSSTKGTSV